MPKWIPCGEKFIVGDVVRWKEAVWVEKGKRKKKLIKVGERRVTAEVLGTDRKGFVCLSVCKCEILANLAARVLEPFKKTRRRNLWVTDTFQWRPGTQLARAREPDETRGDTNRPDPQLSSRGRANPMRDRLSVYSS